MFSYFSYFFPNCTFIGFHNAFRVEYFLIFPVFLFFLILRHLDLLPTWDDFGQAGRPGKQARQVDLSASQPAAQELERYSACLTCRELSARSLRDSACLLWPRLWLARRRRPAGQELVELPDQSHRLLAGAGAKSLRACLC